MQRKCPTFQRMLYCAWQSEEVAAVCDRSTLKNIKHICVVKKDPLLGLHARAEEQTYGVLHHSYSCGDNNRIVYSCSDIEELIHSTSSSTTTSLGCQARKKHLTVQSKTSLMQLVNTVVADLNLPTRVSPPHSHQSQGKVERFHREPLRPILVDTSSAGP